MIGVTNLYNVAAIDSVVWTDRANFSINSTSHESSVKFRSSKKFRKFCISSFERIELGGVLVCPSVRPSLRPSVLFFPRYHAKKEELITKD